MKNRLEIAKQLLSDDGVIFVQCDDNEQAYLKILCDEIFKRENFVNEIIWKKLQSSKKQSKNLSNIKEYILVYKNINFSLNSHFIKINEEDDYKNYPYIEEKTNRRYGSFDFTQKGQGQAKYFGNTLLTPPKGKHWIWTQEKINEGISKNIIIFTKNGTPRIKKYLDQKKGNPLSDLWIDEEVKIISANSKERKNEFYGQKPEALINRILEISTQPNDIVLDFCLGSGTTAAVAHKMGRQYIGIEQMDYIETIAVERLKKVIDGEQGGISKSIEWKGGGEFVYLELKKYNQHFIEEIEKAKNTDTLLKIWEEMKAKSFLTFNLDIKKQDENISEFKKLKLSEQKQHLCEILDKNQLYINISSLEDEDFLCTDEEKQITKDFYKMGE